MWRHGQTEWNLASRFQGQTDVPLDDVGAAQAERAAALLADLRPHTILSSDLQRAARTAAALAAVTGVEVRHDVGLRETHAGSWEGLTRAQIESRFPEQLAAWSAGDVVRPGGGETRIEVADRVVWVIGRTLESVPDGETLVVVTHGGAARAAIGRLLGLPPEHWSALGVLSNAAWSILAETGRSSGAAWRLTEYNAGSLPQPALADDR